MPYASRLPHGEIAGYPFAPAGPSVSLFSDAGAEISQEDVAVAKPKREVGERVEVARDRQVAQGRRALASSGAADRARCQLRRPTTTDQRFASARLLKNARRPAAAVGSHADSLPVVSRSGATRRLERRRREALSVETDALGARPPRTRASRSPTPLRSAARTFLPRGTAGPLRCWSARRRRSARSTNPARAPDPAGHERCTDRLSGNHVQHATSTMSGATVRNPAPPRAATRMPTASCGTRREPEAIGGHAAAARASLQEPRFTSKRRHLVHVRTRRRRWP